MTDDEDIALPAPDGGKLSTMRAAFDDKEEEVVVKGTRPKTVDDDSDWADFWSGGGGDGGYGDPPAGGGGSLGDGDPVAKDTPCVETTPSNIALQELNNQALRASNEIAAKSDQNIEYGVIFYMLNGTLQRTAVFDNGLPGEIDWNTGLATIPTGAVIVGTLHSHPDMPGINDGIPSYTNIMEGVNGKDWIVYSEFLNLNWHGITADPNMLMYIYTNEDFKTRVYDNTDRNTKQKSCPLQ